MPEMLERVPDQFDSVDADDDAVESYWLPHKGGYLVKLDIKQECYTLSWGTPISAISFIEKALQLDEITKETAQGECTIDGEAFHLEMGNISHPLTIDGFPERCSYFKIKDEFEDLSLEIDWIESGNDAKIEFTTQASPSRFDDFIKSTTDPESMDEEVVETVVLEAVDLIQSKTLSEY